MNSNIRVVSRGKVKDEETRSNQNRSVVVRSLTRSLEAIQLFRMEWRRRQWEIRRCEGKIWKRVSWPEAGCILQVSVLGPGINSGLAISGEINESLKVSKNCRWDSQMVQVFTAKGWPDYKRETPTNTTQYGPIRDELHVVDGHVSRGEKLDNKSYLPACIVRCWLNWATWVLWYLDPWRSVKPELALICIGLGWDETLKNSYQDASHVPNTNLWTLGNHSCLTKFSSVHGKS